MYRSYQLVHKLLACLLLALFLLESCHTTNIPLQPQPEKETEQAYKSKEEKKKKFLKTSSKIIMTPSKLKDFLSLFDLYAIEQGRNYILHATREGNYTKIDPVLREWGCQLRAFSLTKMLKDIIENNKISKEVSKHIGYGLFLSTKIATVSSRNFFEEVFLSKTDETKFPMTFTNYLESININTNLGRNIREQTYAAIRSLFAHEQISFLSDCMDIYKNKLLIPSTLIDSIKENLKQPHYISLSHNNKMPFLPLFVTGLLSTKLTAAAGLDVIVNVKRLIKDQDKIFIDGEMNLFYKGENGKFVFQKTPSMERVLYPSVFFEMYSTKVIGEEDQDSIFSFYKKETFSEFIENLIQEVDLNEIVLQYLAVHPQFTQEKFLIAYEKNDSELTQYYKRYRELGKLNKIGTEIYNPFNQPPFSKSIPLNLLHARISSIREAMNMELQECWKYERGYLDPETKEWI